MFSEDVSSMLRGWQKYSGLVSDGLLNFYGLFSNGIEVFSEFVSRTLKG